MPATLNADLPASSVSLQCCWVLVGEWSLTIGRRSAGQILGSGQHRRTGFRRGRQLGRRSGEGGTGQETRCQSGRAGFVGCVESVDDLIWSQSAESGFVQPAPTPLLSAPRSSLSSEPSTRSPVHPARRWLMSNSPLRHIRPARRTVHSQMPSQPSASCSASRSSDCPGRSTRTRPRLRESRSSLVSHPLEAHG